MTVHRIVAGENHQSSPDQQRAALYMPRGALRIEIGGPINYA
jgi:hypothetical protein